MRKKPRHIEDEELDPYATERVKAVSDLFPDDRLKKEFGLTKRESCFVRAYCILLNACKSATLAGYTKYVARNACALLKKERIANSVDAIMTEAVNPVTEWQTISNISTTVGRLMNIVKTGDDKSAVMASKSLLDYFAADLVKAKSEDPKRDDVPDSEIEASLKRMKVLPDG